MNRPLTLTIALLLVLAGSLYAASPVAAADPGLTVQGPTNGSTIVASSVTINFTVTDFNIVPSTIPLSEAGKHPELNHPGEGHLHLKLDLQPLIVWDKNAPYTLTNIAPGNHQLMIELANNDHASLSPPLSRRAVCGPCADHPARPRGPKAEAKPVRVRGDAAPAHASQPALRVGVNDDRLGIPVCHSLGWP